MRLRAPADGAILADLDGDGPPAVVALHGWGRDRGDLAAVCRLVAAEHTTTASLDLPGFGGAPDPPAAWGAADYADVAARAIGELGVDAEHPVVLLGHSFGGRVAVCLAAAHPDLVAGLVLVGVPLLRLDDGARSRPAWRFRLGRRLHRLGLVSDARMEALRRRHGSADYAAAQGVVREVLVRLVAETYEDELRSVRAPTAFVWGERDTAAPPEVAERAAALVADARGVDVVAGATHDVHREHPERVADAVQALLAEGAR